MGNFFRDCGLRVYSFDTGTFNAKYLVLWGKGIYVGRFRKSLDGFGILGFNFSSSRIISQVVIGARIFTQWRDCKH